MSELAALALVEDPTPALRALDDITVGKAPAPGRPVKAFNPIAARTVTSSAPS